MPACFHFKPYDGRWRSRVKKIEGKELKSLGKWQEKAIEEGGSSLIKDTMEKIDGHGDL